MLVQPWAQHPGWWQPLQPGMTHHIPDSCPSKKPHPGGLGLAAEVESTMLPLPRNFPPGWTPALSPTQQIQQHRAPTEGDAEGGNPGLGWGGKKCKPLRQPLGGSLKATNHTQKWATEGM